MIILILWTQWKTCWIISLVKCVLYCGWVLWLCVFSVWVFAEVLLHRQQSVSASNHSHGTYRAVRRSTADRIGNAALAVLRRQSVRLTMQTLDLHSFQNCHPGSPNGKWYTVILSQPLLCFIISPSQMFITTTTTTYYSTMLNALQFNIIKKYSKCKLKYENLFPLLNLR